MSYYRLLGLACEPFSTSPDPLFFYLSPVHRAALYRLRVAVELKRGLSVVVGDIGTGKTTLGRRLSQMFHEDPRIDFHVILNPMFQSEEEFLMHLLETFQMDLGEIAGSSVDCLQAIERHLFQRGVVEGKTVVLMIDEAQQLSHRSLEILRALLNYETNQQKLLQVILLGQMELVSKLKGVPNFWDRIGLKMKIQPLDERSTREMIDFRLRQARYQGAKPLFTSDAMKQIFRGTKGFPRKITMVCHDALEYLVMMRERQVSRRVIRRISANEEALLAAV